MKIQSYKDFSAKIDSIARRKKLPLRVMFELTYRCNFNCIHCFNTDEQKNSKPQDELKTKDVFEILKQLKELGGFYLGFTGGEIFCRQDILPILFYARDLGFQTALLTNGSFIDKNIADELNRLKLNKVDITVHAMNKNVFDRITMTPGSCKKVFAAIGLLRERKIPLAIKSCCMKENRKEVVSVSKFAREMNAAYRFNDELLPRLDGSKEPLSHLLTAGQAYQARKGCYAQIFDKSGNKGKVLKKNRWVEKRNSSNVFNCGAGYASITINPYGELKICPTIEYPKYKILDKSLKSAWIRINRMMDGLRPPDDWACKKCDLLKYCSWCPSRGYLENRSFFTCDEFTKTKARFRKRIEESKK